MVSWPRGCVTPGWGVRRLCESHLISTGQDLVCGETTHTKLRKRGECALHLCLGINALRCSLYTGLCLFSSYALEVHPPWGSWRLLRCLYLVIIPIHQHEHGGKGGRFTWWIDCRAHGSGKKPKGRRWRCCCYLLPVDRPSSAETRPPHRLPALRLACFLNTSVEQERTEPARTKVVCSTLSRQL